MTDTDTEQPACTADSGADGGLFVVGIGASAGGLEALRTLLPTLPCDDSVCYVVAQHLDPKHSSLLVQLLSGYTEMTVRECRHRERLAGRHVYITPPGRHVTLRGDVLCLAKSGLAVGPKPSVDQFLTSLSESHGERALAVILSGTGSDGTAGVRAVKGGGGIALAQHPASAKFDGMVQSAIDTGFVDLVLPPERIGAEIAAILSRPQGSLLSPEADESPAEIRHITRYLAERTGCDFSDYKATTLERRIRRRMNVHKVASLDDYRQLLRVSTSEPGDLCRDILVSVTGFFRDAEAFRALETHLGRLLQRKSPGDSIRVWIPGCATGEEAYSIAIVLDRLLGDRRGQFHIQVFGTDLDEAAIQEARRGVYAAPSLSQVPTDVIQRYFVSTHGAFGVARGVREMVVFARQDLVRDPPFSHLDLVSCRNLLIYFNSRLQARVLPMFFQVLVPGGLLFLGKSESIARHSDLFTPVSKKWKLFRRQVDADAPASRAVLPSSPSRSGTRGVPPVPQGRTLSDTLLDAIGGLYAPRAVLVDERMQVCYVRGDLSPYLRFSDGAVDLNLVRLCRESVRGAVRALLYRARQASGPVRSQQLVVEDAGESHAVVLVACRHELDGRDESMVLLVFEQVDQLPETEAASAVAHPGDDTVVAALERELEATREQLQTTVEELETTNEELQSANEELHSANEELQSANEELETSNEELQSTNEELRTVNQELQIKSDELALANADLQNILNSVGFPLVVLDRKLRITRHTPAARELFDITPLDLGQLLTSVPCRIDLPNLRGRLAEVLESGQAQASEVSVDERCFSMRLLPFYADAERPSGVLLAFVELSDVRAAERRLQRQEATLQALMNNFLHAILSVSPDGTILGFNAAAERIFGYPASEVVGRDVGMLAPPDVAHRHQGFIDRYLVTGASEIIGRGRRVTGRHKDGSPLALSLTVCELEDEGRRGFIGIITELPGEDGHEPASG